MNDTRHTIAVYIPAKNCPELLEGCLRRVQWADEIVVADASTNDDVAKMLAEKFPGVKRVADATPDHRLRLIQVVKAHVRSDFMMAVDADEYCSPELGPEVLAALEKPCKYDGFLVPSVSYLFGERFGPGATQLKVCRCDRYRFEMKAPHEMAIVDGPVRELRHGYDHHNSPSLSMMPLKAFRYESTQAALLDDQAVNRLALDNKSASVLWRSIALEWLRYNVRFLRALWGNRRHGFAGLCMAYAHALHVIAHHVSVTEERRMRAGIITRDRHGYL